MDDWGPLSQHMAVHIVLMAIIAPALAWEWRAKAGAALARSLPYATAAQAMLLWGWHLPPALDLAFSSQIAMAAMYLSLTLCALWFWLCVFALSGERWRAVLGCFVSGKLFCLLGAMLVFAPATLYSGIVAAGGICGTGPITSADQSLAGALMLVACSATYVLAGIVIAVRWFFALDPGHEPA